MDPVQQTKQLLTQKNIRFAENEDLSNHSTMQTIAFAKLFVVAENVDTLKQIISIINETKIRFHILGSGSNTLFVNDFDGIIIKITIIGREILEQNDESVLIKVGSGENWHEFVKYCVNNNWAGNENLAYIPGTVGAAPVQNIAAYGQVQEDTFETLEAINIETGEIKVFNKKECRFSYRTSIFKQEHKDKYIILSTNFRVYKVEEYIPETSYHSRYETLQDELKQVAASPSGPYTLKDVFNTVISIRKKKLPEWQNSNEGTLGSFFLNPFISKEKLTELQKTFPNIQFYPVDKMQYPGLDAEVLKASEIVKIPAGWILEELGWRGKFIGNVGCSPKHALCIITKQKVKGSEVLDYVKLVQKDVKEKTGIELVPEINII